MSEIQKIKPSEMDDHITEHFKVKEMVCKCGCDKIIINTDLFSKLESLREMINKTFDKSSIIITSGFRCEEYNKGITQSKKGGYHPRGMAVDIKANWKGDYLSLRVLYKNAERLGLFTGMGAYPVKEILHLDIRSYSFYNRWIESSETGKLISLTRG